ncbi:MAG: hypothetical protein ABI047_18125, partial [Jatrophihabitantaceae bacterium]
MSRPEGQAADRQDGPVDVDPVEAGPVEGGPVEAGSPQPAELAADEREAQRLHRANRATRGGLAALLCLEAFVVLLVPRG